VNIVDYLQIRIKCKFCSWPKARIKKPFLNVKTIVQYLYWFSYKKLFLNFWKAYRVSLVNKLAYKNEIHQINFNVLPLIAASRILIRVQGSVLLYTNPDLWSDGRTFWYFLKSDIIWYKHNLNMHKSKQEFVVRWGATSIKFGIRNPEWNPPGFWTLF
jgi:hypothetical protein